MTDGCSFQDGCSVETNMNFSLNTAIATSLKPGIIHVNKCKNVQIGNNNFATVYMGKSKTNKYSKGPCKSTEEKLPKDDPIFCCFKEVEQDDLLAIQGLIGIDWKRLGRYLKIDESDIKCISEDYRGDTKEQAYQMLLLWRKTREGGEATVSMVAQALRKCDRADIIKKLKIENQAM
ncbi:receptor-interacting serine/threonine-protein kinase 1-like isoform X2 [Tubulanus polymorphus]|uniref:receptor-interacting serine/threonine-protein kinase 1-like isoform X2 n=1 Tax=Tubulanus polymorphus TaxID=672921 RepID=UPI003DA56F2F